MVIRTSNRSRPASPRQANRHRGSVRHGPARNSSEYLHGRRIRSTVRRGRLAARGRQQPWRPGPARRWRGDRLDQEDKPQGVPHPVPVGADYRQSRRSRPEPCLDLVQPDWLVVMEPWTKATAVTGFGTGMAIIAGSQAGLGFWPHGGYDDDVVSSLYDGLQRRCPSGCACGSTRCATSISPAAAYGLIDWGSTTSC
jgi:hypothetical protein